MSVNLPALLSDAKCLLCRCWNLADVRRHITCVRARARALCMCYTSSGGIIQEGDELHAVQRQEVRGMSIEQLAQLILGLIPRPCFLGLTALCLQNLCIPGTLPYGKPQVRAAAW